MAMEFAIMFLLRTRGKGGWACTNVGWTAGFIVMNIGQTVNSVVFFTCFHTAEIYLWESTKLGRPTSSLEIAFKQVRL